MAMVEAAKKAVISTNKLTKAFNLGPVEQVVLRSLDIEIFSGDFTVIMGSSGAGKSTLLYALSGMDAPTSGEITFDGQIISNWTNDQLAVFRRKNCGFVFQQNFLLDNLSIMDNVLASGLLVCKNKKQLLSRARGIFSQVGLEESIWNKFPTQVSGGEAQRAGIVRALISQPKVVFADEPTGSLNSAAGKAVLDVLTDMNRNGQSVIMVTHDMTSARRGNRVIYLRDGIVCGECGLGSYVHGDKKRQETLQPFLEEMGW
ncbi:MAG: ABC transporter ATP-binding protein [Clostridiales bacterium]|nr:ABC transporter ATP-binding protein [Clostridiales bacterium]